MSTRPPPTPPRVVQDLPDPVAVLSVGRIWRTEDVERWTKEHRPDLHDPAQ